MTTPAPHCLLDHRQIRQKIKRLAYQVYEQHHAESDLVLAGIVPSGYRLAQLLRDELLAIAPLRVTLVEVTLDKKLPAQREVVLSLPSEQFNERVVVVVDDVLNTGRTLAYCLRPFLEVRLQQLQVAVLVNRDHRRFPVAADYVGYALATTLQEHVRVDLETENQYGVYLE